MSISKIEHDKTVVGIKVERRRKMAGTCVDVEDGCGDEDRLGGEESMSAKHSCNLHEQKGFLSNYFQISPILFHSVNILVRSCQVWQ